MAPFAKQFIYAKSHHLQNNLFSRSFFPDENVRRIVLFRTAVSGAKRRLSAKKTERKLDRVVLNKKNHIK